MNFIMLRAMVKVIRDTNNYEIYSLMIGIITS